MVFEDLWQWTTPDDGARRRADEAASLAERDAGAKNALLSAHTSWRIAAEAVLEELAKSGIEFTADDVRARVGRPPGHDNALGGLFIGAAKREEIVAVGFRVSTRREAHARPIRVWRGRKAA